MRRLSKKAATSSGEIQTELQCDYARSVGGGGQPFKLQP